MSDAQRAADFLAQLRALEVVVVADAGRLRCNAPKGVLTPELQQQLRALKDDLLLLLTAERAAAAEAPSTAPLSFTQQRLWFLDRLLPGLAAYNISGAVRLTGRLNEKALDQVMTEIVRRHGSLRTTFREDDGQPVQVIQPVAASPITVTDISDLTGEARESRIREIAREASLRPFDLARGPLFRVVLMRVAPDQHVMHIALHHIIADGWSMGVLVSEIAALYTAFWAGLPSPLPELPIQFADHARWQREVLQGEAIEGQLAYWRRQLGGELPILELPADRPRPPQQSFAGQFEMFSLQTSLVERLRALAQREHATLFMVLLAAFQTLLHRYTGLTDILVGTPIANRTRLETERLIGFFANTVVLRTDLSGGPTFRDVLRRVRVVALDSYAHQDVPFERLVEVLQPARDLSRSPLFQVMFALQNVPLREMGLPELTLEPIVGQGGTAKTDLTLQVTELPEGLIASLEYCTDLFDRETILRFWRHYEAVLNAVATDADRAIADIALLSAEEERQIVHTWNDTAMAHDRGLCLNDLLAETARRTPEAPAVVADGRTLNYRTLDERANRLARLLQRRGVRSGTLVALCLDRTADLPVTMVAILKAGAAYVPLDPAHPADRIRFCIEDAGVACVVSHSRTRSLFEPLHVPLLLLDEVDDEWRAEQPGPLEVRVSPDDLAYVIYTSGSTGKPKGVQVEHRNVVSFLDAMRREPGMTAADTLLAVTTATFDIAGLEVWLPFAVGARVVIASRADTLDPARLAELLVAYDVTVMQATPATWRLLIDDGWNGRRNLRALCGGETLPGDLAIALLDRVAELWNMYGPTETTIWSAIARVEGHRGTIPIGKPIANTRVYVLDKTGRPAPIGVGGELCIGGEGVARGYRNRPEMTAEKFVTITVAGRPRERVYRTGDIARWGADGQLEFLGRRDHQVKVRGYRIELGEIETVLRTYPQVADCVVIVREDAPGDQRIVAYAVTVDGRPLDGDAARAAMRFRLPEYMLPTAFATLPALPLTPNGKIDRRALPPPEAPHEIPDDVADMLMTPMQRRIADIWQRILNTRRIGLNDNFFDVGGHSLILVKLHAALAHEFGAFPLIELFQHTTVAAQANRLTSIGAGRRMVAGAAP